MTPSAMKARTLEFGVRVVRYVEGLEGGIAVRRIGGQLVDAGTSVGANYRAACVARSRAEFNAKLQIALEEADEVSYWLKLLKGAGLAGDPVENEALTKEAGELYAIIVTALKTSRSKM